MQGFFKSNMSSIGCFLSSLLLWRLSISEFFHAKMHFLEYLDHATAKSGFNRRIVSLIDQKFDDEPASYDRDA